MVKDNLEKVKENIAIALNRSGRNIDDVKLIAVSKTKPIDLIMEAYDAGVRDFGENKVQEMVDKYEAMPKDIRWHLIGHLQTNKVKYVVGRANLIHSVDSYKLACEISKEAVKKGIDVDILIEVNISNEDSKFGFDKDEVIDFVEKASKLSGIHIKGLMTVAPFVENSEENRQIFRDLKQLSVDIINKNIDNVSMEIMSMGMSGDYQVAIEEGATCIRVGTSIFGERDYNI